jgi:FkbM family methyltransferase
MLSLGASVTAVEPQPDLARAARETVELNCWSGRAQVITGLVDAQPNTWGEFDLAATGMKGGRAAGRGEGLAAAGLSPKVALLPLDAVLTRTGTRSFELLKLDADGPEGSWLRR